MKIPIGTLRKIINDGEELNLNRISKDKLNAFRPLLPTDSFKSFYFKNFK